MKFSCLFAFILLSISGCTKGDVVVCQNVQAGWVIDGQVVKEEVASMPQIQLHTFGSGATLLIRNKNLTLEHRDQMEKSGFVFNS